MKYFDEGKECLVDDGWWVFVLFLIGLDWMGLLVVRMKRWCVMDGLEGMDRVGVDVKLKDRGKLWWGPWFGLGLGKYGEF